MEKTVRIKKKKANDRYTVSCDESACGGCKSKLFCKARKTEFEAEGRIGCDEGDTVVISMDSRKTILSVLIVFAIPLFLMFAGILAGKFIFKTETAEAALAIAALALGFAISGAISRSTPLTPSILRKTDGEVPDEPFCRDSKKRP